MPGTGDNGWKFWVWTPGNPEGARAEKACVTGLCRVGYVRPYVKKRIDCKCLWH